LRYPTTQDATATSQNSLVAAQLDNNAPSFRNRLYNLFTQYNDYNDFSNEAWTGAANGIATHDSIESVHDQIHGLTGSGGHMTYIDYSAFDPIFFLHHTMIDRCFAMWQVLYPDSFVVPEPSTYGTFTISPHQIENDITPLTPFHNDTIGNFWTSQAARYTEKFGYAYAETAKISGQSTSQMKNTVKAAINTLYGETSPGSVVSKLRRRSSLKSENGRYDHVVGDVGDLTPGSKYREWVANLRVRKHALSGPFFIHLFLGPFSPDPFSWSFEPNLIGTHCIFARAGPHSVNSNNEVTGTIPMTHALLDRIGQGMLASLEQADVEKYLLSNMRYRITMLDDTEVPNSEIPDLKITVVSAPALKAENLTAFPVWGPFVENLEIDGCA
jgi:tyrosinase